MRKFLILSALLSSLLWAEKFDYKGNIGFESSHINHDINNKRDTQNALRGEFGFKESIGESTELIFNAKVIYDSADHERRYIEIEDLYYKYAFEEADLLIGRNTRFWGAMEFYNLVDTFNSKDYRDDPLDYDAKLGAWNIAYTYYFDNSELALIAKARQEDQKIQDSRSILNILPQNYNDQLLTQEGRNHPTVYLKYSGSGEELQIDYALIYQNGYDQQRYLIPVGTQLHQYAYIVNRIMGYSTLIVGDTLYKSEVAYTKSDDEHVSDYAQGSIGLEHTLYGFIGKADLGLIAEYYRYKRFEDEKLGAQAFGNLFDNDVALGFRVTLNDTKDSDILGGVVIDQNNQERLYSIEYNTRLDNQYKLKLSAEHLAPQEDSLFYELDRFKVEFGYYF